MRGKAGRRPTKSDGTSLASFAVQCAACTDSTPRRRRRHLPALHGQHYNRSYRRFKSLGLGASIYYVHTYLEEGAGPKEL